MSQPSVTKQVTVFIFVLGILALISTALLAYMNFEDRSDSTGNSFGSYSRNQLIERLYSALNAAEDSRRGYYTSNDKQYLEPYYEARLSIDSLLAELKPMIETGTTQAENFASLSGLVKERFRLYEESIAVQTAKGNNPKFNKNLLDKGRVVQSDIKTVITKMQSEENKAILKKNETSQQSHTFAKYAIVTGIGISSLIFIGVFIVLYKKAAKVFEAEAQEISREELETIVRERTAEISQINKKLYKKVDELVLMDKALKLSEEYYRMLFEQAHDAIVIFNPSGEIVLDVNNRACEVYGFTKEEFTGMSLQTISKNIPEGTINIQDTLRKGYYHNFQSVHYRKDFTEMLMEINASVIDYKGTPAILSINRDITDRILKIQV